MLWIILSPTLRTIFYSFISIILQSHTIFMGGTAVLSGRLQMQLSAQLLTPSGQSQKDTAFLAWSGLWGNSQPNTNTQPSSIINLWLKAFVPLFQLPRNITCLWWRKKCPVWLWLAFSWTPVQTVIPGAPSLSSRCDDSHSRNEDFYCLFLFLYQCIYPAECVNAFVYVCLCLD